MTGAARLARAACLLAFLLAALPRADLAQLPGKALSQFVAQSWSGDRGFTGGPVNAIAQTADGYLWLGTQKGLLRFDGWNFKQVQLPAHDGAPLGAVLGLLTDGQGNLWVWSQNAGLLLYRNGGFASLLQRFPHPEVAVTGMCTDNQGHAVFASILNGVVTDREGVFSTLLTAPKLPNFVVLAIAATPSGDFWLGTRDLGLFRLSRGKLLPGPLSLKARKINALLPVDDQKLWIGTDDGLLFWDGASLHAAGKNASLAHRQVLALGRGKDGSVWVGTDQALYRLDAGTGFAPSEENREPDGPYTAVFLDREGNLWTGNSRALKQFRDAPFTSYSSAAGLRLEGSGPIYADTGGRIWFAPSSGGLFWMKGNREAGRVQLSGLDKDVVYSIAGGRGDLWLGRRSGGLTHLHPRDPQGSSWKAETFTTQNGLAQNSVYSVRVAGDGSVWAGTLSAGVSHFRNGIFTNYTTRDGLVSNTVASIAEGTDGALWFATPKGVSSFNNGRWTAYSTSKGLPSEEVSCVFWDSTNVLWLCTANGLAAIRDGNVWVPTVLPELLRGPILAVQDDPHGNLWVVTSDRIFSLNRARFLAGATGDNVVREFGMQDGLQDTEGVKRERSLALDPSGRVWFSLNHALSVVETQHLQQDSPPAILRIQSITADGTPIRMDDNPAIPAGPQRVTITMDGVSLAVPGRVRFRTRLLGFDSDWTEPQISREVTYTNLEPRKYVFQAMASNSDGQWNSSVLEIPLTIEPIFWRTWWFRLSCLTALIVAVLVVIRLRVLSVARRMNLRFEERLAERTRIAQELHDTLLQGLLSASMQLHVANEQVEESAPAKPLINRVLGLMGRVVDEGRIAVGGLRSSNRENLPLEQAFAAIPQELAVRTPIDFRVVAEGATRALRPAVRDEVYLVGREGVVNALRHSNAQQIEVQVEYDSNHLRVLVRDNGSGIDPHVLASGRDGHWGLSGMRERTERLGARLRVLSRVSAGTEIEVLVPAGVAYLGDSRAPGVLRALGSFFRANGKSRSNNGHDEK